jgi:hypothetical protein
MPTLFYPGLHTCYVKLGVAQAYMPNSYFNTLIPSESALDRRAVIVPPAKQNQAFFDCSFPRLLTFIPSGTFASVRQIPGLGLVTVITGASAEASDRSAPSHRQ